VCTKLFGQVRPDRAYFGEKDWQQLQVVTRMVADLHLPLEIVGVPTVREPDGLALSSRNRFLSAAARTSALHLSRALFSGVARATPAEIRAAAQAVLDEGARAEPPIELDYLALIDPADCTEVGGAHRGPAVLAVAAKVGATRLIDNLPVLIGRHPRNGED
jgi:pantoate--beta-alanine ligase